MALSWDVLALDYEAEANRIAGELRRIIAHECKRRGLVVALSGGIDSSVRRRPGGQGAGPKKVFGLHMPERDSSAETRGSAGRCLGHLGFDYGARGHHPDPRRLRLLPPARRGDPHGVPGVRPGWKSKIVLPGRPDGRRPLNVYRLVVQRPDGAMTSSGCRCRPTCRSSPPRTSSSASARPSSTTTPTA
jgi:NAD+ synthase